MARNNGNHSIQDHLLGDLQSALGSPLDLVSRSLFVNEEQKVLCIYLESMADTKTIDDYILKSLMEHTFAEGETPGGKNGFLKELPFSCAYKEILDQTVHSLVTGHCVLVDFFSERVKLIKVTATEHRQIDEPKAEATVRGPHEGFTENIQINIGLLRKRIRNPRLRFDKMSIGSETGTTVLLVYMENLAPKPLVEEARKRLLSIRTDSVLESAYIEEYIQDRILSPFPTLSNTERPDVVAAQLLDGKVAVLVDGSSSALLAPMTFFEFFNSPEDYYQRADIASFIRLIRIVSFFTAVFVPSLYVAVTTFHQELIPTQLLISLSAQREGVPFPALFEVLVMEVLFEIIREAGLRMPRAVGQALSIVGAIVLGQAAVDAGLISAAIVIVVSITGITNFVVPVYSFGMTQRLLRFTFVLLAGFMGLFGIMCGALLLAAHLVSLHSFGVPYMTLAAPFQRSDWKDLLVRAPMPWMNPDRLPGFTRILKKTRQPGGKP